MTKKIYDFSYRIKRKEPGEKKTIYVPHPEPREPLTPLQEWYLNRMIDELGKSLKWPAK